MNLQRSYTLIAPLYDRVLERATRAARQASLAELPTPPATVLLAGVGTGLDVPHLPRQHRYIGLDLTHAMLRRAQPRIDGRQWHAVQGDTMRLPLADASIDHVILHLILAVVPEPQRCLAEVSRVLRPGGHILVFDKFLRPGQRAPLRRSLNPLTRRVATRLDVVFETLLAGQPELLVEKDLPALAGGWFRRIHLRRR